MSSAPRPMRGWAALRASGGAGWIAGTLLLGAGAPRERASLAPRRERRAPNAAANADHRPTTPQPFDEELGLLQRVERALRANNPSLALALLGELDERFAETRLGEERQAARGIAECRLQLPGGRQRAERFLAERPASVYAQRVRSACAPE